MHVCIVHDSTYTSVYGLCNHLLKTVLVKRFYSVKVRKGISIGPFVLNLYCGVFGGDGGHSVFFAVTVNYTNYYKARWTPALWIEI